MKRMARQARKFCFMVLLAISEVRVLCHLEMTVQLWGQRAEWQRWSCKELLWWNIERTGSLKSCSLSELICPNIL